ncbi:MAG TPA: hypothetical protein VFK18_01875 [Luteimonas sp.]|nr:hypothetical protein [Luteimonas sp.]
MKTEQAILSGLLLLALVGCSADAGTETGNPASSDEAGPILPPPPIRAPAQAKRPSACELVTAAEMGKILGQAVTANGEDRFSNQTQCIYDSASGLPHVSFEVAWGDAQAAATAMGLMNRREPGIAPEGDDLGDGYTQMGPTLMIRVGEDLVTLQLVGVEDTHATARRILEVAKPRM